MAVRPLRSFFPTADDLLPADLRELGETLLMHLNTYQDRVKQHGWLYQGCLLAMPKNRSVGLGPLPVADEFQMSRRAFNLYTRGATGKSGSGSIHYDHSTRTFYKCQAVKSSRR